MTLNLRVGYQVYYLPIYYLPSRHLIAPPPVVSTYGNQIQGSKTQVRRALCRGQDHARSLRALESRSRKEGIAGARREEEQTENQSEESQRQENTESKPRA